MISALSYFGGRVIDTVDGLGQFTRFAWATWRWFIGGAGRWGRARLLLPLLYTIGTRSILVIAVVGSFVGLVLGVEAYDQFAAIGQESRLGGIINISVVKQIGPVLAAVMLAGRIGGAVTAELGTMRITEQIDAMKVMGADPIAYLVVPRVVACVLMIPILTVFNDVCGIIGGYLISVHGFGVNAEAYWDFSRIFVRPFDVCTGLAKSVFFGLMIGLISCYKGFHCRKGAEGVGQAATEAFVMSFIAIIVANFFLASFLKNLYPLIFGYDNPGAFG